MVAGSFNYTQPANDFNDENLFVLGSPFRVVAGVDVDTSNTRALALHVKAQIERVIGTAVHAGMSAAGDLPRRPR